MTKTTGKIALALLMVLFCGTMEAKSHDRQKRTDKVKVAKKQSGVSSWYGGKYVGRKTANGEVFTGKSLTAAHQTLPFNTLVEVRNKHNGKKVVVRINDRGPFVAGRILDVSEAAARKIGLVGSGTADVQLRVVRMAKN